MMLCFIALLVVLFLVWRSGRFGPMGRGYYRGPGAAGPWGPGAAPGEEKPGQAPRAQGWMGPWGPPPRPEDEALKVLADRLANGDITPDEYVSRVSVLRQQG
jgi:hypothetical protein